MPFSVFTVFYKHLNVAKFFYVLLGTAPIYTISCKHKINTNGDQVRLVTLIILPEKSQTALQTLSKFRHNTTLPVRISELQQWPLKAELVAN
jgi:hypothetical protein